MSNFVLYNNSCIHVCGADVEAQLSSRDEYIYQLKQEMETLVKIKKELATENEQLRSQLLSEPVKKEGTNHFLLVLLA